jgi:hypothetical protein
MAGWGTIVNFIAILAGGAAGLALKKVLKKRVMDTVMQGVGLAVLIIGISGALSAAFSVIEGKNHTEHVLIMIISLAVGACIGEMVKIEERLETAGKAIEKRFVKPGGDSTFVQGFVTATLVFCVGSMAIVGSLEDGINRNSDILFAKSTLDGIASIVFASAMGVGVLFSAVPVGVYQGAITLLAVIIAPFLGETLVTQMSLIGSVLIMAIGLNMLGIAKIKVGNLLPAIFIPAAYNVLNHVFF